MRPPTLALIAWGVACLLGGIGGVLAVLFRHPGAKVFEVGVSTLTLLQTPERYVRDPYARVVQILSIAALLLFGATIIGFVLWRLLL